MEERRQEKEFPILNKLLKVKPSVNHYKDYSIPTAPLSFLTFANSKLLTISRTSVVKVIVIIFFYKIWEFFCHRKLQKKIYGHFYFLHVVFRSAAPHLFCLW